MSRKQPTAATGATTATDAIATVLGKAVGLLVGGLLAQEVRAAHARTADPATIRKAARAIPEAPHGVTAHATSTTRISPHSPGATPEHGHWVTIHGHATFIDDDGKFHFRGPDSPARDPKSPTFRADVARALKSPVNGPGHQRPDERRPDGVGFHVTAATRDPDGSRHETVIHGALDEGPGAPRRATRITIGPTGSPSMTTGMVDQHTGVMQADAGRHYPLPGAANPDEPISQGMVSTASRMLVGAHARDLAQYAAHHRGSILFGHWFRPVPRTQRWIEAYDRDHPPMEAAEGLPADMPVDDASEPDAGESAQSSPADPTAGQPTPKNPPAPPASASPEAPDWGTVFPDAFNRRDIRRTLPTGPLSDGLLADATNPGFLLGDAADGGREAFRSRTLPLPPGRSVAQYTDPLTGNRSVAFFTETPQVTTHPTAGAPYRIELHSPNHGIVAEYHGDPRDASSVMHRFQRFVHWADGVQKDALAGPGQPTARETASTTTHDETDPDYLAAMQARDPLTARLFNRNADVSFTGSHSSRDIARSERAWFGRTLERHEYAEMVGCPDNHTVEVTWNYDGDGMTINCYGPWFGQTRTFTRDEDLDELNLHLTERPGEPPRAPYVDSGPHADAYNNSFFLRSPRPQEERANDTAQGRGMAPPGLGTRIIAVQLRKLRALGFARLHTGPIGDYSSSLSGQGSGYYAWPRMGYESPLDYRDIARFLQRKTESDAGFERQTARMAADFDYCPFGHVRDAQGNMPVNFRKSTYATPCDPPAGLARMRALSEIMETWEGREFWRAYGEGIDGYIDLRPGSPEMLFNQKYLEECGIEIGPAPRGR